MAPDTLIFTTSHHSLGGDEVLVTPLGQSPTDATAFIQVLNGAAFLVKDEVFAVVNQLLAGMTSLEILEGLFPDPLRRPLYTIEDVMREKETSR
jgi:hypothetical protein